MQNVIGKAVLRTSSKLQKTLHPSTRAIVILTKGNENSELQAHRKKKSIRKIPGWRKHPY